MSKERPYNDRYDENTQTLLLCTSAVICIESCNLTDKGV